MRFSKLGFKHIRFDDFETNLNIDFSATDVIYVCGGNTFKLLHYARESDFKSTLQKFIEKGGLYIGISAGTNLVTPTIEFVSEMNLDPNDLEMKDFIHFLSDGGSDMLSMLHPSSNSFNNSGRFFISFL